MSDPTAIVVDAQRIVISVLREMLDAERARADARLAALARIDGMRGREDADAAFGEACDVARTALEER